MPKVRRSKKSPPDGWELIEPTLEELEAKMREGQLVRKYTKKIAETIFDLKLFKSVDLIKTL